MKWFRKSEKDSEKIEDSLFRRHGFVKLKKRNKKVYVNINGCEYQFNFETNVIYEVPSENIKFAVCVSEGKQILFINQDFIPLEDTTSPYRTFYDGLMNTPFRLCYPFDKPVTIEVQKGKRLRFFVVKN